MKTERVTCLNESGLKSEIRSLVFYVQHDLLGIQNGLYNKENESILLSTSSERRLINFFGVRSGYEKVKRG
jgi:hypothetical protein